MKKSKKYRDRAKSLQASTSNSTPASIKKKIKKKENMIKAKSEIPETEIDVAKEANAPAEAPAKAERSSGFIFMCNSRTKPECYRHQVFGVPRVKAELVERIKPGARLFLYDFDLKLLYGIYRAVSAGGINLVPEAFGGAFPAQVKFKVDKDCIPLPERSFKQAILENYDAKNRFEQNLSSKQVHNLVLLFQPVSKAPHQTAPLQYTENRHPPAHLPPPAEPNRYLPPLLMRPPEDPYRSRGHLAPAHMPPPEDQYKSAGQVAASHLPPPEDPYRTAGHMLHPHPLAEDPYRSVGDVVASYLHPSVAYRSGRYLMHHQLPPEDPYRHTYLPRVPIDSRYLSPFAPPPANDPHAPQHLLAVPTAPPPTDSYYPAPASDPYGQLEAGRAYYHENPALSDRFANRRGPEAIARVDSVAEAYHRTAHATLSATTEPTLQQQRHNMQSAGDANRLAYMESIQRQATNTATAAPVSSLYAFAGVAPARR